MATVEKFNSMYICQKKEKNKKQISFILFSVNEKQNWTGLKNSIVNLVFNFPLIFGLKSLDLVWTVLRKAEIERQIEHTVRFFFIFLKISLGFW